MKSMKKLLREKLLLPPPNPNQIQCKVALGSSQSKDTLGPEVVIPLVLPTAAQSKPFQQPNTCVLQWTGFDQAVARPEPLLQSR